MTPHPTLRNLEAAGEVTQLGGINTLNAKHFLRRFCQHTEDPRLVFSEGRFGKNPSVILPRLPIPSRRLLGLCRANCIARNSLCNWRILSAVTFARKRSSW